MNTEEVRIQIRNIEDRAYCMMYYNQKLRSARECRRIAIAKDNDVRRLLIEYASTKVGEVAFKAWFAGMQQGVIFDHNDRKEMWEGEAKRMTFDEWYTKYKLSQI